MSDFPFKKGDLVTIKTSFYNQLYSAQEGIIIEDRDNGWFEILIGGVIEQVHRNYLVTPPVKPVKLTRGHR